MKQTICDYCGKVIEEPLMEYRGDLDESNLAIIEVKPTFLNRTTDRLSNPDLCRECIIQVLRG